MLGDKSLAPTDLPHGWVPFSLMVDLSTHHLPILLSHPRELWMKMPATDQQSLSLAMSSLPARLSAGRLRMSTIRCRAFDHQWPAQFVNLAPFERYAPILSLRPIT